VADRIGVYVLGMHRSGTSALARVIDLLGVPVAERGLVAPSGENPHLPDEDNPAGYWEPLDLVRFNISLLRQLGGRTMAPPPLEVTAHAAHLLRDQIPAGRELFRSLHPGDQWAWKDPRNCVLLPFWRAAIADRAVAVLAYRHPAEVAASMQRRDPRVGRTAISLWEHSVRAALFGSQDLPRLVVDYADLIAQPERTVGRVGSFLATQGLHLSGAKGHRQAVASIDSALHRHRRAEQRGDLLTGEQRELASRLSDAASAPANSAQV
jgi:hypothetical protein